MNSQIFVIFLTWTPIILLSQMELVSAMPSTLSSPLMNSQHSKSLEAEIDSQLQSHLKQDKPAGVLERVKRFKKDKKGVMVIGQGISQDPDGTLVIPYFPETSWANAAYDRPGVYGGGWGTQYIHPVVIDVQGETTEPNYDPTASNYHNPGNWPSWVIKAMAMMQNTNSDSNSNANANGYGYRNPSQYAMNRDSPYLPPGYK